MERGSVSTRMLVRNGAERGLEGCGRLCGQDGAGAGTGDGVWICGLAGQRGFELVGWKEVVRVGKAVILCSCDGWDIRS